MDPELVFQKIRTYMVDSGFNLTLKINPAEYDTAPGITRDIKSLFSEAQSIILVGFAGNSFWGVFQEYLEQNPDFENNNVDLIDNYTVLKFAEASEILRSHGVGYMEAYPFGEKGLELNFLKLGELGGAGVQSLLGILLHPRYGPWISLRGAFITNLAPSEYDAPLSGFQPCPSCHKPCISACPAHTISEGGWDWESCMKFRLRDETCSSSCASRRACPYGEAEQYSEEQLRYHHEFVLKNIREYFHDDS